MVLCIDIGNSSIKVAALDGDRVSEPRIVPTTASRSVLRRLLEKAIASTARGAQGAAVASVVPFLNGTVDSLVRRATGLAPFFVGSGVWLPFRLEVAAPQKVGSDRIAAAAGAVLLHGGRGTIVVDVGSAVTVDLVLDGRFLGGLIMAGPELQLRALSDYTAQLPALSAGHLRRLSRQRAATTRKALASGSIAATAGGVKEAVRYLQRPLSVRPRKIVTGGAAPQILERLPGGWKHDPHLVLRGIKYIYELNL